jgi:hypothetical protein
MVLATETTQPAAIPWVQGQPSRAPIPAPNPIGRQRAEEQPGKHVAQKDGLPEAPGQKPAKQRCSQYHGDIAKDKRMSGHPVTLPVLKKIPGEV